MKGLVHLGLGERADEIRACRVIEISVEDRWDPLRGDPRFETVIRRVGLASG